MFKKLFKSKKEKEVKATTNANVEKLNTKELNNVVGGGFGSYVSIKGTKQG
jgi:bacteriocin-like protein